MKKEKIFADIFVRLNSVNLYDYWVKVEQELRENNGVFSVHTDECRNSVIVAYDPEIVSSDALLEIIRDSYVNADKVAKTLLRVNDL